MKMSPKDEIYMNLDDHIVRLSRLAQTVQDEHGYLVVRQRCRRSLALRPGDVLAANTVRFCLLPENDALVPTKLRCIGIATAEDYIRHSIRARGDDQARSMIEPTDRRGLSEAYGF